MRFWIVAAAVMLLGGKPVMADADEIAGVVAACGAQSLSPGQSKAITQDATGGLCITARTAPSAAAGIGLTPTVSPSPASSLVIKASPGNLYSAYATSNTATAGFFAVINATNAPTSGSAITPLACAPLPASGNGTVSTSGLPPAVFSVGIVALVTSAANCYTYTSGTITAFMSGSAQ